MTELPLNGRSESDQKAVREQLDRVLKSAPFLQARRRQRFLEYIVNETLAGRGERLKGYDVAREVFDRSEAFDPNVDPIVRVEAARVRDKLREYYEADGRSDPIRIDLPKGSYTPHIEFRQTPGDPRPDHLDATTPEQRPSAAAFHLNSRTKIFLAASTAVLLILLAGFSAWRWLTPRTPFSDKASIAVSQVPGVAVLPFVNISGDASQEYFSDGLTEDIMTELARTRDLRVLARNTTFQYKGKAVDVAKLGRDLGVRYVLEGSVRRSGDDLRISAQLIDAATGDHIWANKFDRKMADVFLVQDEIVGRIVAKIAGGYGAIQSAEAKSARKNPDQIQSYDLILRAHDAMYLWTHESFVKARELLNQAIAIDPENARARRELAWLAVVGLVDRLDKPPVPPQEIVTQASKAVLLDPSDGRAHMVAAAAYYFNKQLDLFEHEAKQAIELAPHDAESVATIAYMTATSGDWPRGVAMAEKANALNADAAEGWYHATLYLNYYLTGNYERALEIIRQDPNQNATLYSYVDYLPILGQLGRKEEAREKWQKILAEDPNWTAESFVKWYKTWNIRDEDTAKFMEGIYKSGVLERTTKPSQ